MQDLIEVLSLGPVIEDAGYKTAGLNFEAFFDDLCSSGENGELRSLIESRVYDFFSSLVLPDEPTIYDYLILSLREKDIIATFNWDPFLLRAYMRNEVVAKTRRPRITFLHGNVAVGVCCDCGVAGVNGRRCSRCGRTLAPSKLLFPAKHKNYNDDPFIKTEWDVVRHKISRAYFLTVFGYSAPTTDVEARSLMLDVWKANSSHKLTEVEVVDIRARKDLEGIWREFFFGHHYMTAKDMFGSYLFSHPRRSCEAFASATLMCRPWRDNPFPKFQTLQALQDWVAPLIAEEERHESGGKAFSSDPRESSEESRCGAVGLPRTEKMRKK